MPPVSVSITKEFPYRGAIEDFSNVYTYDVPSPDAEKAAALVGELVAIEQTVHSSNVKFTGSRVWTSGGTKEQNITIYKSDLAVFGNNADQPNWHAQSVYEIQWRTDRPSVLDKPVYLRKYVRAFSTFNTTGWTNGMMAGSTPLTSEVKSILQAYADRLNPLAIGAVNYQLIAPSGRRVNQRAVMPKYTSIHELKY